MSTDELVVIMLVAIGSAIVAVLATVWISSLVQAHRVRIEPTLGDARDAVVAALSGDSQRSVGSLSHLSRFSKRYIVGVMLDVAPSVSGSSRVALVDLGYQIGVIDRALSGVNSRRWSTRLHAARVLTAFGIESPDRYRLFNDTSPDVRAQAASWCVAVQNPVGTEHLIGLLGDGDGQCRFAAQDALIRIGLPATDALVEALAVSDDDVEARILEIAAASGDDRYAERARAVLADPFHPNRTRAVAALASTGDPGAGPALVALLDDSSDRVVLAATAGLAKLAYWSGAAAVEPLLSHPSWEIRKQAATTMLALGPPGTVLLRADAPGVGPAAEMALHALQLQALLTQEEAA
jgi:HEAT repeat protein